MNIKWDEPKASFRARWKEQIISEIRRTSWPTIAFLFLIAIPLFVYFLEKRYPNFRFHWFFVPMIIPFVVIIWLYFYGLHYFLSKSTISMDEEGVRLGGPDGRIRKYLYDKMTSIRITLDSQGNYFLSWQYEGKEITRAISQEINISEVRTLIENNSYQKMKIGQP